MRSHPREGQCCTSGIHAPLGELPTAARVYEFAFDLDLQGMERLEVVPVGRDTLVELRSAWPTRASSGGFCPRPARSLARLRGKLAHELFSTNVEQLFNVCGGRECAALVENTLGVMLIQPVDIYLQAERAVKYGVLFIGLTFAAFFLFELFRQLRSIVEDGRWDRAGDLDLLLSLLSST